MYEDNVNEELLSKLNETSKCANPVCNGSIISQRGNYDVREHEKQYGLMCDLCNGIIAGKQSWTTTCNNCGRLVGLFFTNKRIRVFVLKCKKCGGTSQDESKVLTRFKLFINKLKHLIK